MKLFFDANVIFSAPHRKEGRAQDLVALARGGRCELLTSTYALEEARRNLEIKSAGFDARLAETLAQTTIVGEARAGVVNWAQEQGLPLKDAPVLAAAVHAKADLLATGAARDFGHLFAHTTRGTRFGHRHGPEKRRRLTVAWSSVKRQLERGDLKRRARVRL